ncbi:MAG: S41 family peptidase [Candidatus Pacebacteria bacterium]|nr:S41 family peptidase [Candidatus Paceibacterota bacterium]MBP9839744.1 S41 family peptidase [Candidatus Paceibacterota bacterium]
MNKFNLDRILKFSKSRYIIASILLIGGFFCLGIYIGINDRQEIEKILSIENKEPEQTIKTDFSPFWKVWNIVNEKHPDAETLVDQDRVYGAISGLLGSLNDPYTVFFDPDETKSFQEEISGNFSGVGMEVGIKDGYLTVVAPLKGTPADKAGMKTGDRVIKIDGIDLDGYSTDQSVKLIRGERGTPVVLTVLREGEKDLLEVTIIRDIIEIPTLDYELRADGVFVISLYTFSENSDELFREAMVKFREAKTDKLLLDLRGNPGGYLDSAVKISSWFLPKGKTIVTEDYGDDREPNYFRSKGYAVIGDNLKFVILMDGGSASASEIVAGAMQDYGRAKLIGEKSFGKGSVQEVIEVTDDTVLKITVAKWLTPNGNSISQKGLTPDYPVAITREDLEKNLDPQFDKAIEVLKNWNK